MSRMVRSFMAISCAASCAVAGESRPAPALIMSLDYDDWDLKPAAIDAFLRVVKDVGFTRMHWRVAHEKGFLYRSKDAVTATSRLDSYGGPDFDPVRYGVQKGHELGLEVYSYVDAWENLGFLGTWGEDHPDFCMMMRDGKRWTGGISYAYPEGRAYRLIPVRETARLGVDGVYIENWSWHGGGPPSAPMGLEPPVAERYKQRYGTDPRTEACDPLKLKTVQGEFYREFLVDAKNSLAPGQKLAFSYVFSQAGYLVHMPVLDFRELVASHIIDVLILGVSFGPDWDCWLTQEGHDQAREWAEYCHQHGAQFVPYLYTDNPYVACWERFGAPGVRARWKGDHAWLADTGVDGFTNRNVPECLGAHGAPGSTDRAMVSKYLAPAAEQLWSGAAEGLQAPPGSLRPLWTPARLPDTAPTVLVLMSTVQASRYPETHLGLVRQYRTLLANLGCGMELATTKNELESHLAAPRKHAALILAHQCWDEPWIADWLTANGARLLEYVKNGGTLLGQTGPGSPLTGVLGLECVTGKVAGGDVLRIQRAQLPAEMARFLPDTLDLKRNVGGYTFRQGTLLKDFIDPAPLVYNPSKLPEWATYRVSIAGPAVDGEAWPVLLAGRMGEGKILCATTPFLAREMVAINPADGPDVPEHIRLWQAIGHWLFPGRELPLDAAMAAQDQRFAAMDKNSLANGSFEDGWIMGHPAYWMAEGREPGTWVKSGQGLALEDSGAAGGGTCLRLDAEKVASLTSMRFPVRSETGYVLTGQIKASETGGTIAVTVFSNPSPDELEVEPGAGWRSFELRLKSPAAKAVTGFDSRIVSAWVDIRMPGRGTVWLDGLRLRRDERTEKETGKGE